MGTRPLIAAIMLSIFLIGGTPAGSADRRILSFRCTDIVVIGRVRSLSYEPIDVENDLLGHGVITMRVTIKKVLAGEERREFITARIIAHGQLREDRDFLLVLERSGDNGYRLREFAMLRSRHKARLADRCDPGQS